MLVEVGAVGEGPRAVRAAVRALPGVVSRVLVQRPALREAAPALPAAVHARPRTRAARLATDVRRPRPAGYEPANINITINSFP